MKFYLNMIYRSSRPEGFLGKGVSFQIYGIRETLLPVPVKLVMEIGKF